MFLESIRWRLQLWLAFLLLCTLSGFGVAMFELHRMQEFEPIEDELQQRLAELTRALHSTSPRLGVYLRSGGTRLSEWLGREQADLGQTNATPELKDKDQQKGESPSSLRQEPQGLGTALSSAGPAMPRRTCFSLVWQRLVRARRLTCVATTMKCTASIRSVMSC